MELKKRDSESILQYHKRIIDGKLVDGTLSDIDYAELSPLVYGKTYSSDVARRMFYGSKRTLDLLAEEQLRGSDNTTLSEIENKIIELKKEQVRFRDQRREYNKLLASDARSEHLFDCLISAANNLGDTVGSPFQDIKPQEVDDCEGLLVFSDWHYGMVTSNIYNIYDTETCRRRVRQCITAAAKRLRLHKCSKLHIAVLGDLCHGGIHVSARVASEELVCDQIMQSTEILAQAIEHLSQFVPEVLVYTTYGNHARTIQNKADSVHRDNMERLVPWWLKQRFSSNDNIVIFEEEEDEFLFMNICNHNIVGVHGDLDSVKSAPRLISSLFSREWGEDVDYIILGDKHHRESFSELDCTATVCGSLCGTDDYAHEKRLYSLPSQLLLIINKVDGVDAEYHLNLI